MPGIAHGLIYDVLELPLRRAMPTSSGRLLRYGQFLCSKKRSLRSPSTLLAFLLVPQSYSNSSSYSVFDPVG